MLNYLAAVLPADVGADARLIALQCALRVNDVAQSKLPYGVLRGLRLGAAAEGWHELTQAEWLRPLAFGKRAVEVRMVDIALLAQHPARPDRLQAADWALRTACRARPGSDSLSMLVTLCLASHCPPGEHGGTAEAEHITRECGISLHALHGTLDHLRRTHVLKDWGEDQVPDDLRWTLTQSAVIA
ncbi:hypothetical protein ACFZA1_27530 [Streptomyces filipinensis]|uniref:hypothetical protein n=1 Tax=Streptomyces filipinensis TaxID=66887 RepID=UPI0036E507E9